METVMPELPEVETVRRSLLPAIDATVRAVWDSGLGLHGKLPPPRRKLRALIGARIDAIRRHGKYLLIDVNRDETLLVHLGMTGRLLLGPRRATRRQHTHLVLGLGRRELAFVDPRRFGQVDVFPQSRLPKGLAQLGPDALEQPLSPDALHGAAKARQVTLKAFVLDQRVLAGVGNIYASEALWRARIRPARRSNRLTYADSERLLAAIAEVFHNALVHGGTTLQDFVNAEGRAGENASNLWVYDREGKPCLHCDRPIRRIVQQGRATYYCPTCQAR
jgi:formamidopyrimidine-DNA glycosylase